MDELFEVKEPGREMSAAEAWRIMWNLLYLHRPTGDEAIAWEKACEALYKQQKLEDEFEQRTKKQINKPKPQNAADQITRAADEFCMHYCKFADWCSYLMEKGEELPRCPIDWLIG